MPSRNRRWRHALIFGLKSALAAALIWWLAASGQLEWSVLSGVRFGRAFVALVVCRIVFMLLPIVRWQRLAVALGLRLSMAQALRIGLIGNFVSIVAPAWVGQDGARLYYGAKDNQGQSPELVSSVLADRVVGLVALVLLALFWGAALLMMYPQLALAKLAVGTAATLAVGGGAGAILLWIARAYVMRVVRWQFLSRMLASVARYRGKRRVLLEAVLLSWMSQTGVIAAAWFGFVSLGWEPPALAVCAITPLISLSNAIPLTPMGLGVSDSLGEALYRLIGIAGGAEANLIVRFAALLTSIACVAAYLLPVSGKGPEQAAGGAGPCAAPASQAASGPGRPAAVRGAAPPRS